MSKRKSKASSKNAKTPTIGFLIDWLGGTYQSEIWRGVADAAEDANVNLICFSGGSLSSPYGFLAQSNVLYELVSENSVDGLVIATGALGDYVSRQRLTEFCQQFRPLPMVGIALELEAMPTILVDNQTGMREAVNHLIEVHGYQKIAFIKGPEAHQEAEERYQAYLDSLYMHDIPFNPELLASGDFTAQSGIDALMDLLARGQDFEALVAVDDSMALAIMHELQRMGKKIPQDVAVVGFDDIAEAQFTAPAFTTVRQPIYAQGRKAIDLLLEGLGIRAIQSQKLPTELIVRQSCGCPDAALVKAKMDLSIPPLESFQHIMSQSRKQILAQIRETISISRGQAMPKNWEVSFLDDFLVEMASPKDGPFLAALTNLIEAFDPNPDSISQWQSLLTLLRSYTLPNLKKVDGLRKAENLFQQAQILISSFFVRKQAFQRLEDSKRSIIAREVGQDLLTTLDISELLDIVSETIPSLGIKSCYISVYEKGTKDEARLLLAFDEAGRIKLKDTKGLFSSQMLVPEGLLPEDKRFALVAEPLFFREEHIGFVLMGMDSRDGALYSAVRQQLSSALRGALLLQEHQQMAADLQAANERLQILSRGKDEFVSNVSHEFRTPIANLSLYLQLLTRRPERMNEYTEILNREVGRLSSLIEALLTLSRMDQSRFDVQFDELDLNRLVRDFVHDRMGLAQANGLDLVLASEAQLSPIQGDEKLIGQALSILITNALNYTPKGGKITVATNLRETKGSRWAGISVIDTGIGIQPEEQELLFSRFFRGRAGKEFKIPGTGLGLAIAKQIIDLHEGEIEVFSEGQAGQGTRFDLWLPLY
jgi:DNA-binding LacI/PurR family transcriptional regulator/signal transduction histidine kinase